MLIRRFLPALILLLAAVPTASAHRPDWSSGEGATPIADIVTSWAYYRDLSGPEQVDVYAFTASAGDSLHAGINIPAIGGLERYGVTVALFGPGLPTANPADLPPGHPEGLGAIVFPTAVSEDFFEPFTQTNYWGRQQIDLTLPETGEYFLAVWHPGGAAGKYVLDVGTAEVFGPADLFQFPVWWVRVHAFFGHTPYLIAGGLAAAAALAGLALVIIRRRAPKTLAAQHV